MNRRSALLLVLGLGAVAAVVVAGLAGRDGRDGRTVSPTPGRASGSPATTPAETGAVTWVPTAEPRIVIAASRPTELGPPMEIIDFPGAAGGRCITIPEGVPGNPDAERHPPYLTPAGVPCTEDEARKQGLDPEKLAPNGWARYRFTVVKAGRYLFWARKNWSSGCGNTFRFRLDDGPTCDFAGESGTYNHWGWALMSREPVTFQLAAGEHTLTVLNREDGFRLDQFLLTTNPATDDVPVGVQPVTTPAPAAPADAKGSR